MPAHRLLQQEDPAIRPDGGPGTGDGTCEILRTSSHVPVALEQARNSRGLTEEMRSFISAAQSQGCAWPWPAAIPCWRGRGRLRRVPRHPGLSGTVDYAEMINRAADLLRRNPPASVRALRTIFVDEYQDTDPAQVALLQQLAAHGAQVIAGRSGPVHLRVPRRRRPRRSSTSSRSSRCPPAPPSRCRPRGASGRPSLRSRRVVPRNALGGIDAQSVPGRTDPRCRFGDARGAVAVRV